MRGLRTRAELLAEHHQHEGHPAAVGAPDNGLDSCSGGAPRPGGARRSWNAGGRESGTPSGFTVASHSSSPLGLRCAGPRLNRNGSFMELGVDVSAEAVRPAIRARVGEGGDARADRASPAAWARAGQRHDPHV
jgi:hypothetical protein